MYVDVDTETLIPLEWTKEIAVAVTVCILLSVLLNISALFCIYNKRKLRCSSSAIIVANLACVDILVTFKDLPMFYRVSLTGQWVFEENWCATYGLTNVIFIIVSVSTLVTIATERYVRSRELAAPKLTTNVNTQRPIILGYVIAHTTLSYSLSLLWSKYVFITRKAFCRVEWPPHNGFSITFLSSFVFILPVSFLIFNMLYKNKFMGGRSEQTVDEFTKKWEKEAQNQLHVAVAIFLLSWTPYVAESLISSLTQVSPVVGAITACVPLLVTSLLPIAYVNCVRVEPAATPKMIEANVVIQ